MLRQQIRTRRFNVEEYHRMAQTGILGEDDRVELVDGELVEMAPIGARHLACVVFLNHLLVERSGSGGQYFVSVQNPVRLGERDEPQPDLSLLRNRPDPGAAAPPGPGEVLVAIEVADTTLSYDKNVKLPLYARAGIPEAWIVDLGRSTVELHSDPGPDGYRASRSFGAGQRVASSIVEDLSIVVDEVLG